MNLFKQYGIKEVADVTIYSITRINDEEFYTPVMMFDSLKVSTFSKSMDNIVQRGGYGNASIIGWSYIKDIKLRLEDALFSQATMSLYLNGQFSTKVQPELSTVMKLNVANKYGQKNYSVIAYPSPELTKDEQFILFTAAQAVDFSVNENEGSKYNPTKIDDTYYNENRKILLERYYKRQQIYNNIPNLAMPDIIIDYILNNINSIRQLNKFSNDLHKSKCIDRFEKCVVKQKDGLWIDAKKQKENLLKKYRDCKDESYIIYYDPKTMNPFFSLNQDLDFNDDKFNLKYGTVFYKWSRTVDLNNVKDTYLGTELIINPETFPGEYKIIGETYIRDKYGKDKRLQLCFNRVKVTPTTNIELKADSAPTVFSMDVNILKPKNGEDMVTIRNYDVDDDLIYGGTRIIPQDSKQAYSSTILVSSQPEVIENKTVF